jgi:hypothetical protein
MGKVDFQVQLPKAKCEQSNKCAIVSFQTQQEGTNFNIFPFNLFA